MFFGTFFSAGRKESKLIRDRFGLPLIVLYMLCLVLAAWPSEIRPSALNGASIGVFKLLESVGIRAGMAVFAGQLDKRTTIVRSRCIVVKGVDAKGTETQLYPADPCPAVGFRWKPVIYEHMIRHWVGDLRSARDLSNLWAMGDHFCNLSPGLNLLRVEITRVLTLVDYETGHERSRSNLVGRVKCRY